MIFVNKEEEMLLEIVNEFNGELYKQSYEKNKNGFVYVLLTKYLFDNIKKEDLCGLVEDEEETLLIQKNKIIYIFNSKVRDISYSQIEALFEKQLTPSYIIPDLNWLKINNAYWCYMSLGATKVIYLRQDLYNLIANDIFDVNWNERDRKWRLLTEPTLAEEKIVKEQEHNNSDAEKLAGWCKKNLDLTEPHYALSYGSLGPIILDCIYSLQAKYFAVTVPLVKRYGDKFMKGDEHSGGYTVTDFIHHIEISGGTENFANEVLKNRQVIGGRRKSEVCLELAKKLVNKGIETKEDFQNASQVELDKLMRSVKGIGDAAVNYTFMLAGDPNRVKPDVHIHHCVRDAIGHDVTNEECQVLFRKATKLLNEEYPELTVHRLDGLVWGKYRVGAK